MDPITLTLMSVGLALGFLASAKSFYDVYNKLLAMQKLERVLLQKNKGRIHLLKELAREISEDPSNTNAFSEAQEIIESSLTSLSKTERRQVEQGLYQDSSKGKSSYVANLLEESTKKKSLV
jgi:hypothetical protein